MPAAKRAIEADAARGDLFLLLTGADGGGPVDVFVGEPVPEDIRSGLASVGRAALVAVPSGALVVGGAEDYRSGRRTVTSDDSLLRIPPGDYALQCYRPVDEEAADGAEDAWAQRVGKEDVRYFDRMNRMGCALGSLTLLLFPALAAPLGWKIALPVTAAAFLAFFHVRERILKRNARYARLAAIVPAARLRQERPVVVFELRALQDRQGWTGGAVRLDGAGDGDRDARDQA